jgi:Mg2+ and Co2+ transporter CorA
MDRTVLLRRLAEAEKHLAAYEHVLARQRHVIDTIARSGHDTAEASALLREFQGIQAMHVADRDRLRVELMT